MLPGYVCTEFSTTTKAQKEGNPTNLARPHVLRDLDAVIQGRVGVGCHSRLHVLHALVEVSERLEMPRHGGTKTDTTGNPTCNNDTG